MIKNPKYLFLGSSALLTLAAVFSSNPAYAQCATTGAITADCNLTSDTTGAITIGNGAAGVTVTITSNVNLANTIDDDDTTPDGAIATAGTGLTITQSADIGDSDALLTLSINDGDQWTTTADVNTTGDITIGGGTSGTFIIDGSASTVEVNSGAGAGGIEIAAGGTLNITDTTSAVSVGITSGIDIASGGELIIGDDSNLTIGAIDGDSDGVGTLVIETGFDTDAAIGENAFLANIEVDGGTFVVDQDVYSTATTFTSGGATVQVDSGATLASNIVGSSGIDSVELNAGGAISGIITLGDGNDILALNGGTLTTAIDGGAGTSDTITLGADYTTANTIQNFEAIDVAGNVLTVETAITDVATGTQEGLNVNGGTLNINSSGSVEGTIYDSSGTGTLFFGADGLGGTINIEGVIEDVNMEITSGTVDTNGNPLGGTVNIANVTINSSTRFNVNDNVTSDGDFINIGTLFIDAESTFSTNTQTASTGTFIIEVEHSTSADEDNAGMFAVTGGDIDLTGSTIEILIPESSGVIADGTEFLVGDGLNTVTGGPGGTQTLLSDNSFLYDFYLVDGTGITTPTTDDDLYVIVDQKVTDNVAYTSNNASAIDAVLTDISSSLDVNALATVNAVVTASTQDELNVVAESLLPVLDGSVQQAGLITAENTFTLTTERLAGLRQNRQIKGMATGDVTTGVKVWMQPFIQGARQRQSNEVDGYNSFTVGIAGGFDNASTFEDMTIGFAAAYATTDIDSDSVNRSESEVNSLLISMYGDYDIDKRSYLNWQLGYTYNDVSTTRYNISGISDLSADVDYGMDQFSAYLEAGRDIKWGHYTTFTPNISAAYSLFIIDDYREMGALGAGLHVQTEDASSLDLGIGTDISWIYRKKSGSYIKPKVSVKASYDAMGEAIQTSNRFLAANDRDRFTTEGADPAQFAMNGGVGFAYFDVDNWEMSAEYDLTYKQDYLAHTGFLKLGYKF